MSRNYDISLRIRLQNGAAEGLKRFHRDVQRESRTTAQALDVLTRSTHQLERGQAGLETRTRMVVRTLREFVNMRAPHALISGVQKLGSGLRVLQGMSGVTAGVAAGAYVMARPVGRTMDYSMSLAHLSNVAYADSSMAGRRAGKSELDNSIRGAVRSGGGSRESALDALGSMISQGMDRGAAMQLLPKVMRTATGTNSDANDIATLVMKARASGGIKDSEIGDMLDMSLQSGNMGGFELRDMARWLPRQFAAGGKNGMKGMKDLNVLLSANQAAITTSGSADEAGNNVANLLNKITSQDTQRDAAKMGIDLTGTLVKARGKGVDPLTAFVNLAENLTSKDKRYTALKAKASSASTPEEKREIYEQQAALLQGSALGQLIQDQEASKALVGIMGQRDEMRSQQQRVASSRGAVDLNFSNISEEAGYKLQQAGNEKAFAETDAFTGLASVTGDVAKGLADIAAVNPKLAATTVAATTALAALTATAAAGSIANVLTGGGGVAAGAGGAIAAKTLAKRLGIGAIMSGTMGVGSLATAGASGAATVAGGVLASGAVGYGAGSLLYKHGLAGNASGDKLGELIARALAAVGNNDAQRAIQVQVMLDGQQVAAAVNTSNSRSSARQ